MQLRYDDDFVEAAVFLCASGRRPGATALQVRHFYAQRERCYSVADPDKRNAEFFQVHFDWFREWGLEPLLRGLLADYPLLEGSLNILGFRQARAPSEEGAELYVDAGNGRNAMVALRMERLERDSALLHFLRREYLHLHDMVDPAFGYSPRLNLGELNPTQRRLVRDRYRLLWDITIDGRLAPSDPLAASSRAAHKAAFDRAFAFWIEVRQSRVFEFHWTNARPLHDELLSLAADPRDLSQAAAPMPGGSCPLCHFPTFEWAESSALSPGIVSLLLGDFPSWTPEQGACKRCLEIYEIGGKQSAPT